MFPLEVRKGVTVLVEGVDYSLNDPTLTQITWITALDGSEQYEVDYGHPTVALDPDVAGDEPFGTLLVETSTTDTSGEGQTRVRYADDATLEGFSDQLTVSD